MISKMELFTQISLTLTILFVLNIAGVTKADEECSDMVVGLMESQMKNMVPCIKDLNLNDGKSRSENYNCIMKCMLVKAGTLTPDGGVTVLQSIISILEMFPNKYIEKAFTEIQKCQEFAGQNLNDASDTHCNLYGPLLKCGVQFMMNVCKN